MRDSKLTLRNHWACRSPFPVPVPAELLCKSHRWFSFVKGRWEGVKQKIRSNSCQRGQNRGCNCAVTAIVPSPLVWCGSQMGLYKLERYSHKGYLIKVFVMALAGEVTRELSPIRSWSNKNYKIYKPIGASPRRDYVLTRMVLF